MIDWYSEACVAFHDISGNYSQHKLKLPCLVKQLSTVLWYYLTIHQLALLDMQGVYYYL